MTFLFMKPFCLVVLFGKFLLQSIEGFLANNFLVSRLKSKFYQIPIHFCQCSDYIFPVNVEKCFV